MASETQRSPLMIGRISLAATVAAWLVAAVIWTLFSLRLPSPALGGLYLAATVLAVVAVVTAHISRARGSTQRAGLILGYALLVIAVGFGLIYIMSFYVVPAILTLPLRRS